MIGPTEAPGPGLPLEPEVLADSRISSPVEGCVYAGRGNTTSSHIVSNERMIVLTISPNASLVDIASPVSASTEHRLGHAARAAFVQKSTLTEFLGAIPAHASDARTSVNTKPKRCGRENGPLASVSASCTNV